MKILIAKLCWPVCCALSVICQSGAAHAQSYPARPIRLIVPWPAGATADTVARTVTAAAGEKLGQQIVIDNRGGASTIIGTDLAAKSARDGYTLVQAPFNFGTNPSLFPKLPYDSIKDFSPVALFGVAPIVLVVNPRVEVHSTKDLIRAASASPEKFNYASAGNGSSNHLAGALFARLTRIDLTHVPYRGGAPAATAVVAGEVQLLFSALSSAITHVRASRLRALSVASDTRSPALPSVPTMAEEGVAGCVVGAWHGVLAPAGTPKQIINRLNFEIARALKLPEVSQRLVGIGFNPVGGSPREFEQFIKSEMARWSELIRTAKVHKS